MVKEYCTSTEPVVLDNCWDLIPRQHQLGIDWDEELILPLHCTVLVTRGGTKKRTNPCENLKLKFF